MTLQEEFHAAHAVLQKEADRWMERAGVLLADRPGWGWSDTSGGWTCTEFGEDRMPHTRRSLTIRRVSRGDRPVRFPPHVEDFLLRFVIHGVKATGSGSATDEADFGDEVTAPDDAVAWVLAPRSDTTIVERLREQEQRALDNADKVNIAGLTGRKVDFGYTAKKERYEVVDLDGVGRVRYTCLGGGRWRVSIGRRRRVASAPEGDKRAAAEAVRDAVIALDKEISATAVRDAIHATTSADTP